MKKNPTTKIKQNYLAIVWRQLKRNKFAMFGFINIVLLIFIAFFADFLANDKPIFINYKGSISFPIMKDYLVRAGIGQWPGEFQNVKFKNLREESSIFIPALIPYSPNDYDLENRISPPNAAHWLGTDETGRDVLSRMIHGTRISLSIGVIAVAIYTFIGVLLGSLAGYFVGWVDIIISRLLEMMYGIPTFFLIITVVAFLPPSIFLIMLVIGITGWPPTCRYIRAEFFRIRNIDYVSAARALGFSTPRIIFRHILPNALAPVFVTVTFGIASAILIESSLSFLGFGVPPNVATWGSILSDARNLLPQGWWLTTFPGLAIFFTITVYNLFGEGLRDAMDPRIARGR